MVFARDAEGKTINERYPDASGHRGQFLPAPCPIAFDGGKGFVRLYGIGKVGSNLLIDQAGALVMAMSKHFAGPIRMELKEGDCTLKMSEPIMYTVRRLVVAKSPARANHFWNTQATERADDIRREIVRGLLGQARWIDEGLADTEPNCIEHAIPSEDSLMFDVLEGQSVPVEIKPGISGMAYKNVIFCTNLDLSGPWSAGKLRSRGYGLIRRYVERGVL
jgi:hypothetical protein